MAEALLSNSSRSQVTLFQLKPFIGFGKSGWLRGCFRKANGVAINRRLEIFVADTNNNRIQIFDIYGNYKRMIQPVIKGFSLLDFPTKVVVRRNDGFLFVAERIYIGGIKYFDYKGNFIDLLRCDRFHRPPKALTVDNKNRVLVLEHDQTGSTLIIFDVDKYFRKYQNLSKKLMSPNGLAAWDEKAFISDYDSNFIEVFNYSGDHVSTIGEADVTKCAIGVCMSEDGYVLVGTASVDGFKLLKFMTDGTLISVYISSTHPNNVLDMAVYGEYVVLVAYDRVMVFMCVQDSTGLDDSDSMGRYEIQPRIMNWRYCFSLTEIPSQSYNRSSGVTIGVADAIYVADSDLCCIQVFDKSGQHLGKFGDRDVSTGFSLRNPGRIILDRLTNYIYVIDRESTPRIVVFDHLGRFLLTIGSGRLWNPRGFAIDNSGKIFVIESRLICVKVFDLLGSTVRPVLCKGLGAPSDIAIGDNEEIFMTDSFYHCVQVYNYNGDFLRRIGNKSLIPCPLKLAIVRRGLIAVADNRGYFHLTFFTEDGKFVSTYQSQFAHRSCNDIAVMSQGSIVIASDGSENQIFVYGEN